MGMFEGMSEARMGRTSSDIGVGPGDGRGDGAAVGLMGGGSTRFGGGVVNSRDGENSRSAPTGKNVGGEVRGSAPTGMKVGGEVRGTNVGGEVRGMNVGMVTMLDELASTEGAIVKFVQSL